MTTIDWNRTTLGETLRAHARARPDHRAIVSTGQRWTYADLDARVDVLAHGLRSIGVERGDQVALWMANCPDWIVCWLACARAGATTVAINTRYRPDEVAYILRQSNAKVLIAMDHLWSIDFLAMVRSMVPALDAATPGAIDCEGLPRLRSIVLWKGAEATGAFNLEGVAAAGRARRAGGETLAAEHADDPVIIVYTSGTTGHPKGAMHSHVVLENCANMARWMHTTPDDVVFGHMPFYHVAGAFAGIGQALVTGATLVTLAHWEPDAALDLIAREGVTIFGGIPTHFIDCVDALRRRPRAMRMKSAWIGGAPVTPAVATAAFEALGLEALQAVYGMTETTSMTTLSEFDAPLEVLCSNKGKPIGDFEVEVRDPDSGEALPTGCNGEVWVRGHLVMSGYYEDPQATAKVMTTDGWFRTGDLGEYDADGYLRITGRLTDLFIVGGSNAYPAEIERVLQDHPGVKQAVVVGVPHPRLGEVGFAFVERAAGAAVDEAALTAYCRERLADFKVPRHLRFVDDFPRTSTGKLQRFRLSEIAGEALGAG